MKHLLILLCLLTSSFALANQDSSYSQTLEKYEKIILEKEKELEMDLTSNQIINDPIKYDQKQKELFSYQQMREKLYQYLN